jgi:Icc-related predicted phosphoesterase
MPQESIQLCLTGAELNRTSRWRSGNLIRLPDTGRVIVAGDLHGHFRNFERIMKMADLANHPDTHVILQEIIHGGPEDDFGGCLSYRLLFEAIRCKIRFPDQVHILLGNHDTAVISNSSVLKCGREMNRAMKDAMKRHYEEEFHDVMNALVEYLLSQPLAIRCANGVWISHSLPADNTVDRFDLSIFNRPYTLDDIERSNAVYLLTWGRRHGAESLNRLAKMLDVEVFVLGHQPQEMGWGRIGNNTIILASEHNYGCVLFFNLAQSYTADSLVRNIVPLSEIE